MFATCLNTSGSTLIVASHLPNQDPPEDNTTSTIKLVSAIGKGKKR